MMLREEEEFNEGKKDAEVDKLNNKPLRNMNQYTPAYRNGYMSVYGKKTAEKKRRC